MTQKNHKLKNLVLLTVFLSLLIPFELSAKSMAGKTVFLLGTVYESNDAGRTWQAVAMGKNIRTSAKLKLMPKSLIKILNQGQILTLKTPGIIELAKIIQDKKQTQEEILRNKLSRKLYEVSADSFAVGVRGSEENPYAIGGDGFTEDNAEEKEKKVTQAKDFYSKRRYRKSLDLLKEIKTNELQEKYFLQASCEYQLGNWGSAQKNYEEYLTNANISESNKENSFYHLYLIHYYQEEYPQAVLYLKKLLISFPHHEKTPDFYLLLAQTHQMAGQKEAALKFYGKLLEEYPGHPLASIAKKEIDTLK